MRMGEYILRSLVKAKKQGESPCHESFQDYFQWQFESSGRLLARYPGLSLAGKSVLEIGCGTGGRTAYIASQGTARTVGIDINADEIQLARKLCEELHPEVKDKVEYLTSQEDSLVPIGEFDIVLFIDAMEHVVSPLKVTRLAYQYTKPGGCCYFNTVGWYHHAASHTGLLPWVQVFFSDETILNVIRWQVSRPDYTPNRFDSSPPIQRWQDVYHLRDRPGEYLNKITLAEIKLLARYTTFRDAEVSVLPFENKSGIVWWGINLMSQVPVIQEIFHSGVVVKLTK